MAHHHPIAPEPRDRTRREAAKACALTRKGQRAAKSARLFMALAFPAALDGFTTPHRSH